MNASPGRSRAGNLSARMGWSEPIVVPPGGRSWWLREALAHDPGEPCPPLSGDTIADVLVIGGGYTGLWTAWFLKELEPDVDVAVLEHDICGGGPSGRNGGFVTGWWDELPDLVEMYGANASLATAHAAGEAVGAIGRWCDEQGVDAWFAQDGYVATACSGAQEAFEREGVRLAVDLGVADEYAALGAAEVRARCDSPVFGRGVLMRAGATVQPARLARGLRRVLLERGVRIFEGTPVSRYRSGPPAEAETPGGLARAPRLVVAAGAWTAGWPGFERRLATWTSHVVLTAPAPERLEAIGWTDGECITDARATVQYFRTTPDGRIAFGGGGGRVASPRRLGPSADRDPVSIERATQGLRRLFPAFADVPIEDAWGGPIDVSPTHLPFFGTTAAGNVHFGLGYSGNGVAPSALGGRILARLALGREDGWTRLPIVDPEPRRFPPEPLKTFGANLVREAVVRTERAQDEGRRASFAVRQAARIPRRMGYRLGPEDA
jgi:glycine/D-amino acid oxidase-like deaminating enzyme